MSRHFAVDDRVCDADRPELFELAAKPATTTDVLHAWLLSKGYKVSRTAAWKWLARTRKLGLEPVEYVIRRLRLKSSILRTGQMRAILRIIGE